LFQKNLSSALFHSGSEGLLCDWRWKVFVTSKEYEKYIGLALMKLLNKAR